MTVGVNVSSFRLKEKNSRKDEYISFFTNLSQYKETCIYLCDNIIALLETFYKLRLKSEQLVNYKKYFRTEEDSFIAEEKNNRIYVSFTILCGAYGIHSNITNIDNDKVEFNRKANNADVKEFRVMFAFSKDQRGFEIKKGVVLFEVIGQYGIKTLTTSIFKEFLSTQFNLMPFFYTVCNREAFERLVENGNFKKINLIKNEVSPEFSNMMGINCGKETKSIALTTIREKRNFIDKLLNLATSSEEVYELDDEYDDISLTIEMGGRTKTTNIRDIRSLYIVESLPEDVLDIDGALNVSNMNKAMMEYADDYLNNMIEGDEIYD